MRGSICHPHPEGSLPLTGGFATSTQAVSVPTINVTQSCPGLFINRFQLHCKCKHVVAPVCMQGNPNNAHLICIGLSCRKQNLHFPSPEPCKACSKVFLGTQVNGIVATRLNTICLKNIIWKMTFILEPGNVHFKASWSISNTCFLMKSWKTWLWLRWKIKGFGLMMFSGQ